MDTFRRSFYDSIKGCFDPEIGERGKLTELTDICGCGQVKSGASFAGMGRGAGGE